MYARFCRSKLNIFLANRGNKMECENLNKSLCEELFAGEVDMLEEPLEDKSQTRRHRDEMHRSHGVVLVRLQKMVVALQEMENSCKTKKTCS